jgi:ATPase subunit of ABC transporter with duplicated ATPase domains
MIRLDNISKHNGKQLIFIEASAALQKGEKIGLVGPNGAGKTTLFRMITREEEADEGQISVDRGISVGLFSQDVGEMAGMSAAAAVMQGAGAVSDIGAELATLEAAMADPDQADKIDSIIERYGDVQARFEELGGYALEGKAREVLDGLGFSQEMMDGDVGNLSGGWKMRVALGRILLMRPDVMLLDEPSNHLDLESLIWLEQFLGGYDGALMMTSHDRAFMNRVINKVIEIDGGALTTFAGDYEFYEAQRAMNEKQQRAQFERQQAMLAKEVAFIERFKARASHAAQVQSRVKKLDKIERVEPPKRRQTLAFEFPQAPRSGDDVVNLRGVHKRYGSRTIYDGLDLLVRRRERYCVLGVNGAGKIDSAEAGNRHDRARRRDRNGRGQRENGLLRPACHGFIGRRGDGIPDTGERVSARRAGIVAVAGGRVRVFQGRSGEELPGIVGRREGAVGDGADALRSAEFPGAGRTDQPFGHRDERNADRGAVAIRGHDAVRFARPAFSGGTIEPGAGTDARGGA